MPLATTCPNCSTMFKVVSEQLRLQQGKVRCGSCQTVFDGLAHLQLVSNEEKIELPNDNTPVLADVLRTAPQINAPSKQTALFADLPEHEDLDTAFFITDPTKDEAKELEPDVHTLPMFNAAGAAMTPMAKAPYKATRSSSSQTSARSRIDAPSASYESFSANDVDAVDFFAGGASEQPTIVRSFAHFAPALMAVLFLLAAMQGLLVSRNWIAAWMPASAPLLSKLFAPIALTITPPRAIRALSLSSAEVRATGKPNEFQLSAVLANRANHAVAMPSLELVLNNQQGDAMLRRVLASAEVLSKDADVLGIASNSERELRLVFTVPNMRFSDYSVALLYP